MPARPPLPVRHSAVATADPATAPSGRATTGRMEVRAKATSASTVDEAVAEAASTSAQVMAEAAYTADEVLAASRTDEHIHDGRGRGRVHGG